MNEYLLRQAKRQNPNLEFNSWKEFLEFPMSTVNPETLEELRADSEIWDNIMAEAGS